MILCGVSFVFSNSFLHSGFVSQRHPSTSSSIPGWFGDVSPAAVKSVKSCIQVCFAPCVSVCVCVCLFNCQKYSRLHTQNLTPKNDKRKKVKTN